MGAPLLTCSSVALVVGFALGQIQSGLALLALLIVAVLVAMVARRMREWLRPTATARGLPHGHQWGGSTQSADHRTPLAQGGARWRMGLRGSLSICRSGASRDITSCNYSPMTLAGMRWGGRR